MVECLGGRHFGRNWLKLQRPQNWVVFDGAQYSLCIFSWKRQEKVSLGKILLYQTALGFYSN